MVTEPTTSSSQTLKGDSVEEAAEAIYTGRYTRAFLNRLVGPDNFTIHTFPLDMLTTRDGNLAAQAALDDERLSLAYMSDTKLTCLWLHDYPGWLAFCGPLGIENYSQQGTTCDTTHPAHQ